MNEATLIQLFPDENIELVKELFEERAGIREYDGMYTREEAEQLAIEDLREIFSV